MPPTIPATPGSVHAPLAASFVAHRSGVAAFTHQNLKPSLDEMPVECQGLRDARLAHHSERNAIDQPPLLILVQSLQWEGLLEELRREVHNLHLRRSQEMVNDLDRFLLVSTRQGIADFEQDGVSDQQRMTGKAVGQSDSLPVLPIATVDERDHEKGINEDAADHPFPRSCIDRGLPRNPPEQQSRCSAAST